MANIKTYSKAECGASKLSNNFSVREFACKDGSDTILIDLDLVTILQKIRDYFGKAVTINSAYRNATYNDKVGGTTNSYHTKGQAADIVVSDITPAQVAVYAETLDVKGIMQYVTNNFVHIDTRTSKYHAKVVNGVTSTVSTFGGSSGASTNTAASSSTSENDLNTAGVKKFQTWLNSFGGFGFTVDGIPGTKTITAAIKAMQTIIGVNVDGKWGAKSEAACPTLKKSDKGNLVYILQGLLYCRGYIYSGFDGDFGTKTENEVKSYQGANSLTVDGEAGKNTFTKLFAA